MFLILHCAFPSHSNPRALLQLYDLDIVFEGAYRVWREDLSDKTPGKKEALVQVKEFLQWLDRSASSGEDDEEDDGGGTA